jgi:hypothetical protein
MENKYSNVVDSEAVSSIAIVAGITCVFGAGMLFLLTRQTLATAIIYGTASAIGLWVAGIGLAIRDNLKGGE